MAPALAVPLALGAGLWSGVAVVASPPDTRCPPPADLEAAIAAHLPDDIPGWTARYWVEARLDPKVENRLRLELADDRGQVRLRRELSVADTSCGAAAETLALILDRFFQEVAWTASVPLPEVERPPEPPPRPRWELAAGVGARREIELVPAVTLDVRASLSPAWWLTVGVAVQPLPVSQDVMTATVQLVSLPVRASLRRQIARRWATFEIGPAVVLAGERGSATGALGADSGYRLVAGAGAAAAARHWFSRDWAVAIEAGADVTLFAGAFQINGAGEVLTPAPVQVTAGVGLSRVLAR